MNRRTATIDRAARAQSGDGRARVPAESNAATSPGRDTLGLTSTVVIACIGLIMVVSPRPPLWLDEAQSVAIARRSLPGLVDALREDGAPPVYYVALHG